MKMLSLLTKYGYTAPFPIQAQAIPVIMSGRDAICCAKTVGLYHTVIRVYSLNFCVNLIMTCGFFD